MRRALVWDLLGVVLLSVYGTEVCPVLERMGAPSISPVVAGAFLVGELLLGEVLRGRGASRFVERAARDAQPRRLYALVVARHIGVGLALGCWDVLVLGISIPNAAKVVLAAAALGHFAGVDLALSRAHESLIHHGVEAAVGTTVPKARSLVRGLAAWAVVSLLCILAVATFMILRDVDVLVSAPVALAPQIRHAVLVELSATGLVATSLTLNLIASFSRNATLLFGNQTRVLAAVGRGELEASVPVVTSDEFGVIAAHTNRMIEGLRERRKIREALGKIVSPEIASRLLDDAGGLALGGARKTLTLLFSDIRGFTSWSEGTEPEALVADLNRYFTKMVTIVHEEGGFVDKFIGDGMMAVFGLGDEPDASLGAARAARRMIDAVHELSPKLTRPLRIGVGVHRGEVVAGNIGSPDRLEYTFIGDTVNTAARIESLTARLGVETLISDAVLEHLPQEERSLWESRGAHELKGKSAPFAVHGLRADPIA